MTAIAAGVALIETIPGVLQWAGVLLGKVLGKPYPFYHPDPSGFPTSGVFQFHGLPSAWAFLVFAVCSAVSGFVANLTFVLADRLKSSEKAAEERRKNADELEARTLAAGIAQRRRALTEATQLVSHARMHAASLSARLAQAESLIITAEREFAEKLPSPFWEALEDAAIKLSEFDSAMRQIEENRESHAQLALTLNGSAPAFTLGVTTLPDPTHTSKRMNNLYRIAQKENGFPIIYEQRRTNAILVQGFRSLGNAISSLGNRIESEFQLLGQQFNIQFSDLET
ncbi:MAG: hypothetical protein ABL994_12610, partial [Verrucomicrobiales bacterium]